MALLLVRGRILGRIRPQILALNGCLRLLSASATCDLTENQVNTSFASVSSNVEDQNKSCLRSLSANNLTEEEDDQINSLASYVTTKIDEIIDFGKPPLPLVYGAEVYIDTSSFYKHQSEATRLKIISKVVDGIQNIPEVDKIQVFHAKIFYRSMLKDDSESDLTKYRIINRVVNVIQSYPKVSDYEVTEDTHFVNDLGFNNWDIIEVIQALQVEFKLYIPDDIASCKLAIEYIFDHRRERLSKKEFRKHIFLTGQFGESKSEFRRIFVPDKEIDDSSQLGTLYCGSTNLNGLKPFQFFQNMRDFSGEWIY